MFVEDMSRLNKEQSTPYFILKEQTRIINEKLQMPKIIACY